MISENRLKFYGGDDKQGFKVSDIQTYNKFGRHEKGNVASTEDEYIGITLGNPAVQRMAGLLYISFLSAVNTLKLVF